MPSPNMVLVDKICILDLTSLMKMPLLFLLYRSSRSKSPLKSRQCWVDNVSIASSFPEIVQDTQLYEMPSSAAAVAANQNVLDGVNNLQLDATIGSNTCAIKKDVCIDKDAKSLKFSPTDKNAVMSLEDLHNQRLSLPDFICPSSEEKSRQAAVREWIENSSFPWALRTVPLL